MNRTEAVRAGLLVSAGFIDLHAHLREPGFEESETIATGAQAALRGGFTTICAMPNTEPPIDSPGLVAELRTRAAAARGARVLPVATITRGRAGRALADLVELARAGAVAFSDDGSPVDDARLFRHALEYARSADLLLIEHPQDTALSANGVMHEGVVSARLGLPGIPAAAEESAVARDLSLLELVGGRLHLTHLSTAGSVELVRRAKARGLPVTCDVTPHHLAMTDDWVAGSRVFAWDERGGGLGPPPTPHTAPASPPTPHMSPASPPTPHMAPASPPTPHTAPASPPTPDGVPYDSSTKVNPPLRPAADVRALWEGLADGTVDAIATDHAPHASIRKDVEYDQAAFGISGLETALPLVLGGVRAGWCDRDVALRALTAGPAGILRIATDEDDWIAIDPDAEWSVSGQALVSLGKNTPLAGLTLRGRVVQAVVGGETRFEGGIVGTARAAVR